jgi:hypothetical protein
LATAIALQLGEKRVDVLPDAEEAAVGVAHASAAELALFIPERTQPLPVQPHVLGA